MVAVSGAAGLATRLVVGLAGLRLDPRERDWLERWRPAGVILFRRNVSDARQLERLCADLREALPPGAEIMADHEGGPVSVLDAVCGRPPAPWTLGELDDPELTRAVMRDAARPARDCGVDRLLAPCTDVMSEPGNPIIGARAFGATPARVARHAAAAVAGLREGGVDVCLKHWPGHGGTRGDTHLEAVAPVTPDDPAPLQAALDAGADAVMLGHLRLPDDARPASVSAEAAARLRREAPGARLLSDDLTMGALGPALGQEGPAGLRNPGDLPLSWFEAAARGGCDLWLCRGIPWSAWPLPDGAGPRLGPDVDPPGPLGQDTPESWLRAWTLASSPVLDPGRGPLRVWRPAPDHRWGDLTDAAIAEAGWNGEVRAWSPGDTGTAAFGQALVASHAPLEAAEVEAFTRDLADAGSLVALGHPSHADRLARRLPSGWSVEAGHDLRPDVLSGFIARRPAQRP